jgi:prepilin-type N-terminal cleavage/methylation domain-containing protein
MGKIESRQKGFTLLELFVVVVCIGILVSLIFFWRSAL